MKPNMWRLISECVENGVRVGYARAHKHSDDPGENVIKHEIEEAIMNEIGDYFLFDEVK